MLRLRLIKGYKETMINRDESVNSTTSYGDSGVRTMGELADKVQTVLRDHITYGASLGQIQGALTPAKDEDTARAVVGLEQAGAIVAHDMGPGPQRLYFDRDHGGRVEATRRYMDQP